MSHATFTADIQDWLIRSALGDPDIASMFETLCERLHGLGIPLDRASMSWPTLHPLFRSEQVFWRRGTGTEFQQYIHASAGNEAWLKSPLYHIVAHAVPNLRRHLTGPGAREAAGLPPGTGPYRVITDLAVLGYHQHTKRMEVHSLHPGVTLEQVQAATGFTLGVREPLAITKPPSESELTILREEVDPHRYVIGRC